MKRFLLMCVFLLAAGIMVFAQQTGGSSRPSTAEIKTNATQYLNQGKSNSAQYDTMQANLNARNTSNKNAFAFNQLKGEIDKLESSITEEQNKVSTSLERGMKINEESLNKIQRLIDQHKAKLAELEAFASSM